MTISPLFSRLKTALNNLRKYLSRQIRQQLVRFKQLKRPTQIMIVAIGALLIGNVSVFAFTHRPSQQVSDQTAASTPRTTGNINSSNSSPASGSSVDSTTNNATPSTQSASSSGASSSNPATAPKLQSPAPAAGKATDFTLSQSSITVAAGASSSMITAQSVDGSNIWWSPQQQSGSGITILSNSRVGPLPVNGTPSYSFYFNTDPTVRGGTYYFKIAGYTRQNKAAPIAIEKTITVVVPLSDTFEIVDSSSDPTIDNDTGQAQIPFGIVRANPNGAPINLSTMLSLNGYNAGITASARLTSATSGVITLNIPPTLPAGSYSVILYANNGTTQDQASFEFEITD